MSKNNNQPAQNSQETPQENGANSEVENTQDENKKPPQKFQEPPLTKERVKEKRRSFFKKVKLIGSLIVVTVVVITIYNIGKLIYNKTKETFSVEETTTPEKQAQIITKEEEDPPQQERWEIFSSDKYKFSLEYPKGDSLKITDFSNEESLIQIFFKDIVPQENPTGENLIKGYIFQIKPIKVETRDFGTILEIKKNSLEESCPETSTITGFVDTKISEFDAKNIRVYNCNSDYSISFVSAHDYIYEISQIYKGDVGFKQVYKSKVNQILSLLEIYPEPSETPPYIEIDIDHLEFSFSYPSWLVTEQIEVPLPPEDYLDGLMYLAENDNDSAIAILHTIKREGLSFEDYMQQQIKALTEEYLVVYDKTPQGTREDFTVDGQKAVKLSGYSWEGNTLIYINLPENRGTIIVSNNGMSEDTFNEILGSFRFY